MQLASNNPEVKSVVVNTIARTLRKNLVWQVLHTILPSVQAEVHQGVRDEVDFRLLFWSDIQLEADIEAWAKTKSKEA